MGSCFSGGVSELDATIPRFSPAIHVTAVELGYTPNDVNAMYRSFDRLDPDKRGLISIESFIATNNIVNTRFAKLTMSIYDEHGSGDINFEQYLIACWSILSMDEVGLVTFVFRLFDEDDTGELSQYELHEVVDIVCGEELRCSEYLKIEFRRTDRDRDLVVSLKEFILLAKQLPLVLSPAFEMRDILRKATLGLKRWSQIAIFRNKYYSDLSIEDVISRLNVKPLCHTLKKLSFNHQQTAERSPLAMESYRFRVKREKKEKKEKGSSIPPRKNSVGYHLQKKRVNSFR